MDSHVPKPREPQLNVRVAQRTHQLVKLLTAHYGGTQADLIERLIDEAAQVAKREVAERQATRSFALREIDPDEIDGEAFRRQKGAIDHIEP